jgi:hypothetical protein
MQHGQARPYHLERRIGWLLVVAGFGLALATQVADPVGVPLYDGVVVQEPYRYLHPTGDQAGSPTSFSSTLDVAGAESPDFAAATTENPSQAQMIAKTGALELTPGATTVLVSITPIEPPAPAPEGRQIAGNVYRFSVTDQGGAPLRIKPCEGCISLQLRGPEEIGEATLMRYDGSAWVEIETTHGTITGGYGTNPIQLGDYAVIEVIDPGAGMDIRILVLLGAVAAIFLGAVAFLYLRQRSETAAASRPRRGAVPTDRAARIPPKRKRPGGPSKGSS